MKQSSQPMIDAPLGPFPFYPQLLDANLIDCLVLLTIPIVLGKGKRIFGNTSHQVALRLIKCEATPTGVIIATYEREGRSPNRKSLNIRVPHSFLLFE